MIDWEISIEYSLLAFSMCILCTGVCTYVYLAKCINLCKFIWEKNKNRIVISGHLGLAGRKQI